MSNEEETKTPEAASNYRQKVLTNLQHYISMEEAAVLDAVKRQSYHTGRRDAYAELFQKVENDHAQET